MRCIIIEDEKHAAERLKKLVNENIDHFQIDGIFSSVKETLSYLEQHDAPDLIFMDIHLRDGLAFNIFEHVTITSPIIFTTAYNEFEVKAYENNAVDYLLKPIKKKNLLSAISKFSCEKASFLKIKGRDVSNESTYVIRFGSRYYITGLEEIAYFQETENITLMTRKDSLRLPIKMSLTEIEKGLPKHQYARISKHMIANIDAISEITYQSDDPYLLLSPENVTRFKVEKAYAKEFTTWLHQQYA